MTDETADPSSGEKPTRQETPETPQEMQQSTVGEFPTTTITSAEKEEQSPTSPVTAGEVTQATTTADDMTTIEIAEESTEITPVVPAPEMPAPVAPIVLAAETPEPAPQVYEHFGVPTAAAPYLASDTTTPQYATPASYANVPQPGQPAQAVGATPTRGKRSPVLLLVLVALVAFLLGGSSAFAYNTLKAPPETPPASSPNSVLRQYCDGINTANAQEIYDTLSSQARVHTSLDDIQKVFEGLNLLNSSGSNMSLTYGNCTFNNVHISSPLAVATITTTTSMTLSGSTLSTSTPSLISLVLEHNQWKVDFSALAQPQPGITGSLFPGGLPTPTPGQ